VKIPILCLTPGCPHEGQAINVVSEIPEHELDLFFEGFDGSEEADYCPLCGALGVAETPVDDDEPIPVLAGR
jgi:hypothetical protein